jgi:hypothetical protein
VLRSVEGPLRPPFPGGFGFPRTSAQGLPRFKGARFTGAYPFARVDFEDATLPVDVSLEAFNPFVPLEVDDSSLPLAVFHTPPPADRGRWRWPPPLALNAVGWNGKTRSGARSTGARGT